ncbi:MAG: hypothetical protein JSV53_01690 [candidate division WOR-3 bacterium]|nr:MAG: hypothetical protein JSV53_01690 [candidate division WOR-3 bacterium]
MKETKFLSPIFLCAGEPSGDVYAGLFIKRLRKQLPDATIIGVGDGNMQMNGAEIVLWYERLAAFGLSDSLSSLLSHYSSYRQIARILLDTRPKTFIAVAYPGLNIPLCRIAKRHGMKVFYMLPPQIWAWGGFRKNLLKRWIDVVISVFPFEADFYRRLGFDTILMDNPLFSLLGKYTRRNRQPRIGFMPGSRRTQILRNLPVILELTNFIRTRGSNIELCLIAFDSQTAADLSSQQSLIPVFNGDRYQMMKDCDLLVVSSGTASLEAAAMRIPQIFFHRVSFLDDRILRRFVSVREFNIANLHYGKKIVPCFISSEYRLLVQQVKDAVTAYI